MKDEQEGLPIVVMEYVCIDCKKQFLSIGDIGAKRCAACWDAKDKRLKQKMRLLRGEREW